VTDALSYRSVETGLTLMYTMKRNYEEFSYLPPIKEGSRPFIDLLCGDKLYREEAGLVEKLEKFREESRDFAREKQKYHLYS